MRTSYFESFFGEGKSVELSSVLTAIKNGKKKLEIENARILKRSANIEKYGELKRQLPAFLPSGVVEGKRSKENIVEYNSLIVLDVDKLGEEDAKKLKEAIIKMPFTHSCFISPGGDGLKILVRTNSTLANHEFVFNALANYYEDCAAIEVDRSGKDASRLCFVSYDPDIYINEYSEIFSSDRTSVTKMPIFESSNTSNGVERIFRNAVSFTDNVKKYVPGNRNNYVHLLASNCNRMGMPYEDTEFLITNYYSDLPEYEVRSTVKSAFSSIQEHGIFASFAKTATYATNNSTGEFDINNTPYVSTELYDSLPKFFKKGCEYFDSRREKDVFLTGALGILSGFFPSVKGVYDKKEHYANLNCFIIAPAASGKSALNYSRALGNSVHSHFDQLFEMNKLMDNDTTALRQTLFIPADSSSAALKRCLKINNETGIICETEADTLSATLNQDWGGYSDLIRKAFHHEPISYARVDKDQGYGNIEKPKLSICLSGTPGQVPALIGSAENGLFSRMIYYVFKTELKWRDVSPGVQAVNLDKVFRELSDDAFMFYNLIDGHELEFTYQAEHWQKHNQKYSSLLDSIVEEFGDDAAGVLYRMGLIQFRIAMVLSIVRSAELGEVPERIICSDDDYQIASGLSDIYLEHGLYLFKKLPRQKSRGEGSGYLNLFNVLPRGVDFYLKDAVNIANQIGVKSRSVSSYLKKGITEGKIIQAKANGPYFIER